MALKKGTRLVISAEVHKRFILGKQGLWPGRCWQGKKGVEQAIRELGAVQIDPTTIVAPSQDLVLWGRVLDYRSAYLNDLLYKERKFFDYGGNLRIFPMAELPFWRIVMKRKGQEKRWAKFAQENKKLIADVKAEVRRHGPLRNRDFEGKQTENYRSGRDSGVALYYLWLTGELMISRREGKERVYDLLEKIVPGKYSHKATSKEAEDFFAQKSVAIQGILNLRTFRNAWKGFIERFVDSNEAAKKLKQMAANGIIKEIGIEKERDAFYISPKDLPILESLAAQKIPKAWRPLDTTTAEEVVFLSPLDAITGKAKTLFDFEAIWEIYKPAHKRKYGPYTMPILYRESLVGRADFKLDRERRTLVINGVWLEDRFSPTREFSKAFSRGLQHFAGFLGAITVDNSQVDIKAILV